MGGAAAQLAEIRFLVAFLRSKADGSRLLCATITVAGDITTGIGPLVCIQCGSSARSSGFLRSSTGAAASDGPLRNRRCTLAYTLMRAAEAAGRAKSTILRAI